jgi:hypothetical protein
MINFFKNKDSETIYEGKIVKKWLSFQNQIEKRLQILDMAACLDDEKKYIMEAAKAGEARPK